jgi:hypothetical protein
MPASIEFSIKLFVFLLSFGYLYYLQFFPMHNSQTVSMFPLSPALLAFDTESAKSENAYAPSFLIAQ